MARRRKKNGKKAKVKPSLMEGIAYVGIPALNAYEGYARDGAVGAVNWTVTAYTGYSPVTKDFNAARLMRGLAPTAGIIAGTIIAKKLGLNRYTPKWLPFKIF